MKLNLYKAAARIFMAALFVCLLMPGAQAKEKYKATFIYIPLDDRPVTYTYPVANGRLRSADAAAKISGFRQPQR